MLFSFANSFMVVSRKSYPAMVLIALICSQSITWAQLAWERKDASPDADPAENEVVATYPFANSGKQTVKITGIATSCDCISASSSKLTFAPGEKGEIVARYEIGTQSGPRAGRISVQTEPQFESPILLNFKTVLLKCVEFSQDQIVLQSGTTPHTVTLMAKVQENLKAKEVVVFASDPEINAKIQSHTAATYKIAVTSIANAKPTTAYLMLEAVLPNGNVKRSYTWIVVH